MTDLESFLKGYRPGVLFNPNHQKKETQRLRDYPYMLVEVHKMKQHLYFQSNQLKEAFKQKISELTSDSHEFHRAVGLSLGFPPHAVDFYVESLSRPELKSQKIGVTYCGIGAEIGGAIVQIAHSEFAIYAGSYIFVLGPDGAGIVEEGWKEDLANDLESVYRQFFSKN